MFQKIDERTGPREGGEKICPADAFLAEVAPFRTADQDNAYVLGARVELTRLWADKVYLFKISTPPKMRNKKLARFAMDELVSMADRHGVTLSLDCGSLDTKQGRTTDELRDFYGRRGFVESGGYEMTRHPASSFSSLNKR